MQNIWIVMIMLCSFAYAKENVKVEQFNFTVINDKKIEKKIVESGVKLFENKNYTKASELFEQLKKNKKTKLALRDAWEFSKDKDTLYQKALESVLVISGLSPCKNCKCDIDNASSGFIISESGVVVTNYHVIESQKDSEIVVAINGLNEVFEVTSVLAADKDADVAIVQLKKGKSKFVPLPIAKRAKIGEEVSIISHPAANYFVLTSGIASRYAVDDEKDHVYWLSVTAEFTKGSSGAPVFNQKGQVVGIVSKTSSLFHNQEDEEQTDVQMVLRFAVPSAALLGLLK